MHQRLAPYCDKITAHRGGAAHAPENTLSAFRSAADFGATWIETDVCILMDGTPILFHDPNFSRTCGVNENVRSATWETAQTFNAGTWFHPSYTNESIPTFTDGLRQIQSLGLSLNLELKLHNGERQELLDAVLPRLNETWQSERDLLVTSFDMEILRMVRQLRPQTALGLICNTIPPNWREFAQEIQLTSFNPDFKQLTKKLITEITAAGYELYTYTPNDPADVASMWDWGLTGVITDNLTVFSEYLRDQTMILAAGQESVHDD